MIKSCYAIIEKAGINDDNVMYKKAILRGVIGKDIDTFKIM